MATQAAAAMGKKSFTCSICHCKHQSARGQHCKMLKGALPIFSSYVRRFDASRDTSFARNTDETLDSVFAIRRIMAFMHSNTEAYRTWSEQNPIAEVGLESSVVASHGQDDDQEEEEVQNPAQFIRNAAAITTARPLVAEHQPKKQAPATGTVSLPDKGPAPPTLSYEFLASAPRITALVLKR